MWLYIIALVLLIFGIVGGVLTGGIFTIVLLPLGILALVCAIGYGAWARKAQGQHGAATDARASTGRPLPSSQHSNTASAPTTPDELTDARRLQQ
jgi:predicted membrane metal-binding protein